MPAFVKVSASSEGPRLVAGVHAARLLPPEGVVATLASAVARVDSARAGLYSERGNWARSILVTAWSAELGLSASADEAVEELGLPSFCLVWYTTSLASSVVAGAHVLERLATIWTVRQDWQALGELALAHVQRLRLRKGPGLGWPPA